MHGEWRGSCDTARQRKAGPDPAGRGLALTTVHRCALRRHCRRAAIATWGRSPARRNDDVTPARSRLAGGAPEAQPGAPCAPCGWRPGHRQIPERRRAERQRGRRGRRRAPARVRYSAPRPVHAVRRAPVRGVAVWVASTSSVVRRPSPAARSPPTRGCDCELALAHRARTAWLCALHGSLYGAARRTLIAQASPVSHAACCALASPDPRRPGMTGRDGIARRAGVLRRARRQAGRCCNLCTVMRLRLTR